jgi:DNA mismatch repair protein MutS2
MAYSSRGLSFRSSRSSRAVSRYLQQRAPLASDATDAEDAAEPTPLYALPAMQCLAVVDPDAERATPDLLHPKRSTCIDQTAARRALEFAFVAGDSAGIASAALGGAAIADSQFDAASFAGELFVDEFIKGALRFTIAGKPVPIDHAHLKRLLCNPPNDPATVAFRHAILSELESDASLREGLSRVYGLTQRVLSLYDESSGHTRYDMPRWRLDLLGALRELFDALHGPFAESRSGLSRLHDFATLVHDSRGYAELCSLLDFEGDMARVDLHVRLGVDGKIRQLDVQRVEERRTEPFYRGPFARLLWRIGMFFRGYRIGQVELVERWFEHVYAGVLDFLPAVLQLRGDLEFYLSACHFRRFAEERGLSVCLPELTDEREQPKRVEGLFNPLLLMQAAPVVPCNFEVESFRRACILTGPNSGGKTRVLQAIGLAQLLAQAGFLVPGRKARLKWASGLFVSLSQESSADQREGRLGTELLRIRKLFERAPPGSLVILDELCSGTNPSEGEEIFHLVVELLRELEPEVHITTHFLQFAAQLAERADELELTFLQVELDDEQVPTYQFVPGVATTSLAHQTAARLGVTRDELLRLIRRHRPS